MIRVGLAVLALSAATGGAVQDAKAGARVSDEASSVAAGTVQEAKTSARASAEAWLLLADAGKNGQTWDELASGMKAQLTREQWRLTMELARSSTGPFVSRRLEKSLYTEMLAGAPEGGSYVVLTYQTAFEKQAATNELVAVALDGDGKWRVCGYHVRWKKEP